MGWNHAAKLPGSTIDEEIRQQIGENRAKILMCGQEGRMWALVKTDEGLEPWCVLVDESTPGWIGLKIISEREGPTYYDCPEMILNLADDPVDLAYDPEALEWAVAFRARSIIENANLPMTHERSGGSQSSLGL